MRTKKFKLFINTGLIILGLYAIIIFPPIAALGLGAVLTQGILGSGSGKIGGAIMAKWKSINYIRGYAVPKNPNSPAQQLVRATFKAMVVATQELMPTLIPQAWDPYYNTMSGYNAFFKENYFHLDGSNLPTVDFVFSKGTLEGVYDFTSATYDTSDGSLDLVWDGTVFGNGLATDNIFCVLMDKSTSKVFYQGTIPAVTRTTEAAALSIPAGLTASNLICAIFAHRGVSELYLQSDGSNLITAAA
jgi:Family of unknown function (DUF6266)